jgi:hypothetical protein
MASPSLRTLVGASLLVLLRSMPKCGAFVSSQQSRLVSEKGHPNAWNLHGPAFRVRGISVRERFFMVSVDMASAGFSPLDPRPA